MNQCRKKVKITIYLFLSILVSLSVLIMPHMAKCNENPVTINVLTINLLFSEIRERDERLNIIADFVSDYEDPIDIILLQEVVGGPLSGTFNSALDLKKKLLFDKGIHYYLRYRLANGLPGALTVGNAILSRHRILFTVAKTLPFASEIIFEGIEIPLRRKVMMSRIRIPGFGNISVYNTHLCAFCRQDDRLKQAKVLCNFVETVESFIWRENPVILGGDFNANLNVPGDEEVYNLIVDKGFVDTFATANNCTDCCSAEDDFAGCTFAVEGNIYTEQSFPERIDYIFVSGAEVEESEVVFNQADNWVSDHSAVLTEISLP